MAQLNTVVVTVDDVLLILISIIINREHIYYAWDLCKRQEQIDKMMEVTYSYEYI